MITLARPQEEKRPIPQARPAPATQIAPPKRTPGAMEQFGNMAMQRGMKRGLNKGEELVTEYGGKAIDYGKEALGFGTPTPGPLATPSATQMTALQSAAPMASAPVAPAATMGLSPGAAQAVLGSGSAAAPAVANAAGMTGTQLAGTTAAQLAGTGAATGAAGAAGAGAAGAGLAGGGAMAALGTAMPWIGAGLLAGKAFGLFNEGGMVGPLSPSYNFMGGLMKGAGAQMMQKAVEAQGGQPTAGLPGGMIGKAMKAGSAAGLMPLTVQLAQQYNQGGLVEESAKLKYGGPLSNKE
jgi:hypothetical protein